MAEKVVKVIPARVTKYSKTPLNKLTKKRVAAYARVSTDSEEQLTSYEAQVDYYTKYICKNENWTFAGIYTDEGISATSRKRREGFNTMIEDALGGKIDLIITKSISRFARNTVDSLIAIRQLKDKGVEVYFEKENIYTLDSKGELFITIMSSLAQEESRSISENVTWGWRKRIADGKVSLPYRSFLGYERGEDGAPQIVESEAKIVRRIYKMFLEGKSTNYIARTLTDEGIPTPKGSKKWASSTVNSILKNEKYKGSALLQKTFTVDFLQKTKKVNEGELPQYYIEDSHPAIVSKEVYDLAQMEFDKRKKAGHYKSKANCFSGMVFCGDCGGIYGSKVWHSNDKYRKVIWQCNSKFKNEEKCNTPNLNENLLKDAFITVFNDMLNDKDELIGFIELTIQKLTDTTEINKKIKAAQKLVEEKADIIKDYIKLNSRTALPQDEYNKTFAQYTEDYDRAEARVAALEREMLDMIDRGKKCRSFLNVLKSSDAISEFDEGLFYAVVDKISVFADELVFEFKNGGKREYAL